jgi:hypothetical protein
MTKKIAIMQPYIFPYLGYWQLMKAVDVFVIFDDVNFIKKGWIHRNNILVSGQKNLFTLPLQKASQNKKINEINLSETENWQEKLLRSIFLAYKKAPMFDEVYTLIEKILNHSEKNLALFLGNQLKQVNDYLGIQTELISSEKYGNHELKGQNRILDICRKESASHYVNPIGGQELYDHASFEARNMSLSFLKTSPFEYKQFKNDFVPWLSIIDILMFNDKETVHQALDAYELI